MHRIISIDGGAVQCYQCGTICECGDQDICAIWSVPCQAGGYEHPAYILGSDRDALVIETCAAHPYAGCVPQTA